MNVKPDLGYFQVSTPLILSQVSAMITIKALFNLRCLNFGKKLEQYELIHQNTVTNRKISNIFMRTKQLQYSMEAEMGINIH